MTPLLREMRLAAVVATWVGTTAREEDGRAELDEGSRVGMRYWWPAGDCFLLLHKVATKATDDEWNPEDSLDEPPDNE